jgi:hypothetical protein
VTGWPGAAPQPEARRHQRVALGGTSAHALPKSGELLESGLTLTSGQRLAGEP